MSRLLILAVVACLLAPGDASAKRRKGRKGKVVRVERTTNTVRRQPRVLQVAAQNQFISYGWEPEVGTEVIVLDQNQIAGRAQITAVTERVGTCQSGLYDLQFEMDDWVIPFNYNMRAVTGYDVTDDARWVATSTSTPTGNPNEYVWTGIDGDGDGVEDLIVTSYPCADSEAAGQAIGTMATSPQCMDAYSRTSVDAPWERVTHDVWYQCR